MSEVRLVLKFFGMMVIPFGVGVPFVFAEVPFLR